MWSWVRAPRWACFFSRLLPRSCHLKWRRSRANGPRHIQPRPRGKGASVIGRILSSVRPRVLAAPTHVRPLVRCIAEVGSAARAVRVHSAAIGMSSWRAKPSQRDTVSERLRRWTRNRLGSARRGSNPLGVVCLFIAAPVHVADSLWITHSVYLGSRAWQQAIHFRRGGSIADI